MTSHFLLDQCLLTDQFQYQDMLQKFEEHLCCMEQEWICTISALWRCVVLSLVRSFSSGTLPTLGEIGHGAFRTTNMSRAARTHHFRKLRTPSRCRHCESYVYFQGAECDKVGWYSWYSWSHFNIKIVFPGPVFCLLLRVSSGYAQPITGQVTEVTCPVVGQA